MKFSALSLMIFSLLTVQSLSGQLGINIGLPERGGTFVDTAKETYRGAGPAPARHSPPAFTWCAWFTEIAAWNDALSC